MIYIDLPHSSFVRDFKKDIPACLIYLSEDEGPGSVIGSYCGIIYDVAMKVMWEITWLTTTVMNEYHK